MDVVTRFRPLDAHVRFSGRIHVHNLRPVELGAVLWALTWGSRTNLRHRLGMGKPLGYGNVVIRVASQHGLVRQGPCLEKLPENEIDAAQADFVDKLDAWCRKENLGQWEKTDQIKALLALANPATNWPMSLRHPLRVKDFAEYKNGRLALLPVPGVTFPTREPLSPNNSTAPHPSRPAPTVPALPFPDRDGQEVEARDGAEAVFKFTVEGRELTGLAVPELRPAFRKSLSAGKVFRFRIAGLPDAAGRYPLCKPGD